MEAILVRWIDGQTKDGNVTAPAKLELHKDTDGMFRWFEQGYNICGIPAGECKFDTGVSGSTVTEAMDAAWQSWGCTTWNLRTTRTAGRA
jgi:hypothetical protein